MIEAGDGDRDGDSRVVRRDDRQPRRLRLPALRRQDQGARGCGAAERRRPEGGRLRTREGGLLGEVDGLAALEAEPAARQSKVEGGQGRSDQESARDDHGRTSGGKAFASMSVPGAGRKDRAREGGEDRWPRVPAKPPRRRLGAFRRPATLSTKRRLSRAGVVSASLLSTSLPPFLRVSVSPW